MAVDLSASIAGVRSKNPVITASGTFGFGREYGQFYKLSELGGMCAKGLTLKSREGNPSPRIAETPMGILNSVGLQNPGVEAFIKYELPELKKHDTVIIANIAGNTVEEYVKMTEILSDTDIDMLELNISCPNVKQGGAAFGTSCESVEHIVAKTKKAAKKPLIVKLSPNVTSITEIAKAAESAGADCLSLINTLLGMRIDIKTRRPVLGMNVGGMSGPAVKPIAVRMVWQVKNAVNLPVIGMGGISTMEDAVEFMLAGADLVSVGTAMFVDPYAPVKIVYDLEAYMEKNGIKNLSEIVGNWASRMKCKKGPKVYPSGSYMCA